MNTAKALIEIEAFKISEENYQWASGIQSPCYCDNRLLLSYPTYWSEVIDLFCDKIQSEGGVDLIAGVATAGIPHAAAIAQKLKLPMIYVRSKAKGHGKQNKIEGRFDQGQKVAVIEDLFSTGMSSIDAASALKSSGLLVKKLFSIFSYELSSLKENMKKADFDYESIITIHDILKVYPLDANREKLIRDFLNEHVV